MLTYAAAMAGMSRTAMDAAAHTRLMPGLTPRTHEIRAEYASLLHVFARFAKWPEAERSGPPPKLGLRHAHFSNFTWHHTRAMNLAAHVAFNPANETVKEMLASAMELLRVVVDKIPRDARSKPGPGNGIYSPNNRAVAAIMLAVAEGRAAQVTGDKDRAVDFVKEAVLLEDALSYMEPPYVLQPVRQCLGKLLLDLGRLPEAEEAYRADLRTFPENGWSLLGLYHSILFQEEDATTKSDTRQEEVADLKRRTEAAWDHADLLIDSSCPAFEASAYLWGSGKA
uniref:KIF-binding protein n=1 Tax=Pyramimonas obovata TaxID=1411642 RepID=A0A7S0RGC8_9CHLO|mmetsp:Transcript_33671/g.73514  ORF Transcript_33671/g.73514 Transcript_33671/m.73514 type:complete len:283 (+) Transcript_33671:42-890(+)